MDKTDVEILWVLQQSSDAITVSGNGKEKQGPIKNRFYSQSVLHL